MKLTPRELATVLAALRWWQVSLPNGIAFAFEDYFVEHSDLLAGEIDELCEKLNTQQGD